MTRLAAAALVLAGLVLLCACTSRRDLPWSKLQVDRSSKSVQSADVVLGDRGYYEVWAILSMRRGPDHGPGTHALRGRFVLRDEDGGEMLRRDFAEAVARGTTGFVLFRIEPPNVGGRGRYRMDVTVDLDADFEDYYSDFEIVVRPGLRWVDAWKGF